MSYYAAIEESRVLRIFSLVLLVASTGVFFFITLSIIFAKIPEFPSLEELMKRRIDNYFDNINQLYTEKGFWWRIAPKLCYIEMIIEDKLPQDFALEEDSESDEVEMEDKSKVDNEQEKVDFKKSLNMSKVKKSDMNKSKLTNRSKRQTAKVAPVNSSSMGYEIANNKYKSSLERDKTFQSLPFKIDNKISKEEGTSRFESDYYAFDYKNKIKKSEIPGKSILYLYLFIN
jgi:hypothetical protein